MACDLEKAWWLHIVADVHDNDNTLLLTEVDFIVERGCLALVLLGELEQFVLLVVSYNMLSVCML